MDLLAQCSDGADEPLDPSQQQVNYKPTVEQLWAPVAGPAHPFAKDGVAQGLRNHKIGFVEDASIAPFVFDEQYNTFHAYGFAADDPVVILEHLREKNVGPLMRGTSNASDHAHSEAAFGMLKDYQIGSLNDMSRVVSTATHLAKPVDIKDNTYTVDLKKPLVFQVGHLGDGYQKWVHQPILQKESPRFFANDFMESLTKTIWWVVPVVWLPVVCWCQVIAIRRGFPVEKLLTTLPLGIFIWSLVEYTLHRFLFHVKTNSYWANTLHYLLHGCHHKYPMDGYRLVFPPTFAAMFAVPLYGLINLMISRIWAPSVFGFGLLGYILYDVTHYFLHHGTPSTNAARNLKRYHLNHHFKKQEDGYGITSPFWDFIFATLPAKVKYDSNVLQ